MIIMLVILRVAGCGGKAVWGLGFLRVGTGIVW